MYSWLVPSHSMLVQNDNNEFSFSSMFHSSVKFQLSLGKNIFLLNKIVCQMHIYTYLTRPLKIFIPYFVAFFVLSGIALSIKFSMSWSEISANGRHAIVFYFSHNYSE